jgi:DNA-binding response OmpR family regulator
MADILLIEDDINTCKLIRAYFQSTDLKIICKYDGENGLNFIKRNFSGLAGAIIDINLPKMNGLDICHEVRTSNIDIPIMILTHETATKTVVNAFDLGADDYLKKPFDVHELEARLRVVLRSKKFNTPEEVELGKIRINLTERCVLINDKPVLITRKQFDLLLFFMRNKGKLFTREQLIANVWNFDQDPYLNTVDAHISALRKVIGDKEQSIIQTVFGVGYRMVG